VLPLVNKMSEALIAVLRAMRANAAPLAGVMAALATATVGYAVAANMAAIKTGVLAAGNVIAGIISLAKAIRAAGSAMAVLSLVSGGAAGALVAVAALTAGFVAYKLTVKSLANETAAFNAELDRLAENALDDLVNAPNPADFLEAPTGNSGAGDADAVAQAKELTAANQERVRLAQQALDLTRATGEEAALLVNTHETLNALRDAGLALSGQDLENARASIIEASALNALVIRTNAAKERSAARERGAERVSGLQQEADAIRAQVAALNESRAAYEALLLVQAQDNAVAAERAQRARDGLDLSDEEAQAIRTLVAETDRLGKVRDALNSIEGNPFDLTEATQGVGAMAESLSVAVSAAAGLASAFGDVGRAVGASLGQVAQLATNIGRAQKAGLFTDEAGKQQNAGFSGALTGGAGAAGVAAATSSILGGVGAVVAVADAVDLFGNRAKQKAEEMAAAAVVFRRALEDFVIGAGTSLEESLKSNLRSAEAIIKQAGEATGVDLKGGFEVNSVADIDKLIAMLTDVTSTVPMAAEAFAPFLKELEKVAEAARANEVILKERNAADLKRETDNAQVRLLVSQGRDAEADTLRAALALDAEIADARAKYGDQAEALIAILQKAAANDAALATERAASAAAAEAARAAEAELTKQREGLAFMSNLEAREAMLAGDTRKALLIQEQQAAQQEMDAAAALLASGTITREAFARIVAVLNGEMADAMAQYDASLQDEARRKREAVEAEQAASTARAESQNASITASMADAYKTLNPAMAEQLSATLLAAERAELLANAENELVAARYEQLFALQDQAAETKALADAMDTAAAAAKELAGFTGDINDQYLRETGNTFQADRNELDTWLDTQLRLAAQNGATEETIRQINAIYDSRFSKLVQETIDNADAGSAASAANASLRGGDPNQEFITRGVARSASGAEVLQLIDVQLQQLAVLRQIATNTGGGVVQASNPLQSGEAGTARLTFSETTTERIETSLGRRVGVERRFTGNNAL